ncbi:MAG: oligopeptide transporter, OPT family [candidate division WOR-3 bacterium]
MRELSAKALITGILLSVFFGVANAYLALRMGMTVSASIPAAVMAVALFRLIRGSIGESNMVQTIASAGESLAAGIAFTIPAFFILGAKPHIALIVLIALTGGSVGILALSVVRRHLIEEEKLPFPEGTACAQVLRAGERGGAGAIAISGGFAFVYRIMGAMGFFSDKPGLPASWTYLSADLSPAVFGAGYILGPRLSGFVLSGGILGWLVIVPLISLFNKTPVTSAEVADGIWANYLRFIGAGAVLVGGIIGLLRVIIPVFRGLVGSLRGGRDIPLPYVLAGLIVIFLVLWLVPPVAIGPVGAILALILSFLFAVVSARVVGIVGSSSNPVSGMTVAAVLLSALVMKLLGAGTLWTALALAGVVCISAAIAGDTSQDLKTGFLVGATPVKQQFGELLGVLFSSLTVAWAMFLFNQAWGFTGGELRAPQANIMAIITQGVFQGTVPWHLLFIGGAAALGVEVLGIGSLPFAVGLYLPLDLSTGLFLGGLLSWAFRARGQNLAASGLIAGDAFSGLLVAGLAAVGVGLPQILNFGAWGTPVALAALCLVLWFLRGK